MRPEITILLHVAHSSTAQLYRQILRLLAVNLLFGPQKASDCTVYYRNLEKQ